MGKLRVYQTYYEDFRTALLLVPTTQNYLDSEVLEKLTDMVENIGYVQLKVESKKPAHFFGTNLDVMKVVFGTLADLKRFEERIRAEYES